MIKYLLDTNIVIYVLKRRPIEALEAFNKNANRIAISSITLSELIYGAEKSANVDKNLEAVEDFVSHLDVFSYDAKASQQYGQIKAGLEKRGELIGENDIHIAAHAISQGLILVSNNLKEFKRVPNLALENWV
ncbi:type II toxin-antitoxin system VapC family toxin [Polynucleobacter paneuropaeus]|jgi:tRNA(fMet)-specific endonuclease VapC|uniref:Ribonuclease VapC n=1 Tax=Polynucleobacter paneuropaeus TaxID=2527775 RepID=A0A9Q7CRP7_9BURK|nr:type II toxin-antitoxin system VapC family toxin [Polynucleobacter paneuropaeus]MBT8520016.1 type II toxin-antitoxin system VapC family toxin [Polynucleobacter paneuropaeus]MBT8551977.1 type II toxin-antitoxin system VapC family toxin [Polynucleobacter paneuropaeus]MBT8562148.1 type II toxin-antitoxin system VapC family toxin [Polynucleobacter paneuropaeus]MBT8574513.1 type II toxin-antitoxin system VapC family toxin [Polynucleobacter paneuropaeus]MBT8585702.1 type II toxin-antitoxin system